MIRLAAALALFLSIVFTSCMKGSSGTNDPNSYRPIQKDTVRTGQMWGLAIGEASSDIYTILQDIRTERQISYLGVVGNVFSDLSQIQEKIPLYNSLFMDEPAGTPTGIQLGFEASKVKLIYMNNGTPLTKWPSINDFQNGITIGDSVSTLYDKLVAIKSVAVYGDKLQRLSLFDKNLTAPFDPGMAGSAQWQVVTTTVNKRWQLLELNFSSGILTSIYYTLYENY
ncbi:MAG: hypothetical protein ACTHMV_19285 [Chitinophagaceae bacterium]